MICGFALLNLKNIQKDSFYHPSVQHYGDFPPQAELELPELVLHGHCPLMYHLALLKRVALSHFCNYPPNNCRDNNTASCLAFHQTYPGLLISSHRSCTPGPHHPDTISGSLSSVTTTLLSLKKREPKLNTLFQLWFH